MNAHSSRKKKGGRPRAALGMARKRTIGIRVNEAELDALQRKADCVGLPLAQWLRQIALHRFVPRPLVPELNRDAYAELARLAGNINQLAKLAHTGQAVAHVPLLEKILDAVRLLRLDLLGVHHDSESG